MGINAADCSMTVYKGDYFKIVALADGAGDEYVSYVKDITNISTTLFPYYVLRWRTSDASNSFGARCLIEYTAGTEYILGEDAPEFSTTWQVETGTLTTGKTIDKIHFIADDYPDTVTGSTEGHVYFDFIAICKGAFSIPQWNRLNFHPNGQYADIPIPGSTTEMTQGLGSQSATIEIEGVMQQGQTWTISSTAGEDVMGAPFYSIAHRRYTEDFQWFTSDLCALKVTTPLIRISQDADSGNQRTYSITMREKSSGDKSDDTWIERFGLDLI